MATRKRISRPKTSDAEYKDYQPQPPQATQSSTPKLLYFIVILNLIVTFFLVYKFSGAAGTGSTTATTGNQQPAATDSSVALSVSNMKKYAKDMKLDTGKFNKCLDNGESKSIITADSKQAADLGVQGTPGFFVNGRFLAGAFPFEDFKQIIDKEISGEANGTCDVYTGEVKQFCKENSTSGFDPVPKNIDLGNAPGIGAKNPKVVVVEFSDFQCPYCQRAFPTVKKIISSYPNDVKLYYKQLPLVSIHPYAQKAAEASICVLQQGVDKFWQYHDKLFESQGASAT